LLPDEYCREVESYLCRKNDGHLIRIVGPSFERVCSWAARGIPYKIACQGIDRYFVRYYAKPGRRRPVQIDFCENDVLEAFDTWRRAVGVRLPGAEAGVEDATARQRKQSLPEHLDRVCERITNRRAGINPLPPEYDRVLEEITNEVSVFRDLPSPIRGDTRERVVTRLAELDRMMLAVARAHADPSALQHIIDDAVEQLRPFRERMPEESYERALHAAVDNLLREGEKLPAVAFM
jgi:hypothetical protein